MAFAFILEHVLTGHAQLVELDAAQADRQKDSGCQNQNDQGDAPHKAIQPVQKLTYIS